MNKSKLLLIITVIVVPVFCLALAVAAVLIGFSLTSSANAGNDIDEAAIEAEILNIAADYVATSDFDAAQIRLNDLSLPNTGQYISFMLDRYIQEGRGPEDADTQNLFALATAMGATSSSMIASLATATPEPPDTPTPTITPLPTDTPEPTDTPAPTDAPTNTPAPTDEPTETPEPTATPGPTNTPAPPTDTPEPPPPTPPPFDFRLVDAHMVTNPTYNTCPGSHQIFVTVLDVNGNPLDGVSVEDTFRAVPPHITGEKGPGKLEYDLWNNGFALEITKKADGSPATSEVTPKLSSWDEDIPNEWLVAANYCTDLNDCVARKNSNQLCRGHYSYEVTFQKTY